MCSYILSPPSRQRRVGEWYREACMSRVTPPRGIRSHHVLRSVAFVSLLLLAGVGPWWLSLVGASLALLFWGAYEVLLVGCYLDVLAAAPVTLPFGGFTYTVILLGASIIAYTLRRVFRDRLSL